MKLINNTIYIEFADFIASGWKEDTIKKANLRNGPSWMMIPDPNDKRKVLVEFEPLRAKDKERLVAHFGNPYEYLAREPLRKLVVPDVKAELFYKDYRYDGGKSLPMEHQCKYTNASAFLNMLIRVTSDKRVVKKELNLTLDQFWSQVADLIKSDGIELPSSYRRLLSKIDEYKEKGYESLIDWRFGNKLSARIGKSEFGFDPEIERKQVAFIRKVASKHQNFDAAQVTELCNMVFERKHWSCVSRSTVYNVMRRNEHLTLAGSAGKREYNNRIAMQHIRRRPAHPLYYLTLDGWTAELLFQEGNNYNGRLVVVVVLDAFNDYPVGWAIGARENTDLIREANRNAARHIKELFGDYYQPRQLQSDHYGLKNLTPFYQAMAHLHTPAAVGNAKSKIIEPYFKYLNKKYCQFLPNWSGFNITAKKANQPNVEFLDKIKKTFPTKQGVAMQINDILLQERELKQADYCASFSACTDRLIMNRMDRLMVYGKAHKFSNSITGAGLQISLNGDRLVYDSFDPKFRELQHYNWQVVYDQDDLSAVLAISADGKYKFVLDEKRRLPMDVHSTTPADNDYRSRISNYNKHQVDKVMQTYLEDAEIVEAEMATMPTVINDRAEAALKLMFTDRGQQKESLQDAKGLRAIEDSPTAEPPTPQQDQNWQQLQQDYFNSKMDFNEYLD